ncbi:transcriptional activator protein [Tomato chlorotic leaf distortion virus]|nr:transcriptional activator protein [Tomato chlorotic leaf distortion virus]
MLSSSHSTPPCIKKRHRQAKKKQHKKRAIRRRRLDWGCNCTAFVDINCRDHGFTHRGIHQCASSREWRLYLGDNKSPVFQDLPGRGLAIHQNEGVPPPDTVQPQPQESVASPQSLPEFPSLDDIPDSFWEDLFV